MTFPRILIVDDNRLNLELASFILDNGEYVVASAESGIKALDLIPIFKPDLVLMDIQMPDIDGLELTRQLKSNPSTRHIVIVAFTAYAMKGDEMRMRAAGCDGYIAKPIDVATFATRVRSYVDAPK